MSLPEEPTVEIPSASKEAPSSESWDDTTCVAALAHIEELRDQVHRLKNMPTMLKSSLLRIDLSPEHYSQSLVDLSHDGSQLLNSFMGRWSSDMTKEILQYSTQRQIANPDLLPSLELPEFGWEYHPEEQNADLNAEAHEPEVTRTKKTEVAAIIDTFKAQQPSLSIETTNENQTITILGTKFHHHNIEFLLVARPSTTDFVQFEVSCEGAKATGDSITRFISSIPQVQDLNHILNLIAAYSITQEEECAICKTLIGSDWQVPTGRILNPETSQWLAVHEKCSLP